MILRIFALSTMLFACFLSKGLTESTSPIKLEKVGVVLGFTGHASGTADAIRKGVELAMEDLRSANNLHIELVFEDDGTLPVKTVSYIKKLLSQDIRYFIGPTWSFQVQAAAPILANSNAIAIAPAGSSDVSGGAHKGIFHLSPNRSFLIPVLEEFLSKQKVKSVFLLTSQVDWSIRHREIFYAVLKKANINILGEIDHDYGIDQSAVVPILMKIKKTNPDFIFTVATTSDVYNFIKVRDSLQMDARILTSEAAWELIYKKLMTEDNIKNLFGIRTQVSSELFRRYQLKYPNQEPAAYVAEGYDAVMVLNALAKKEWQGREQVIQYLMDDFEHQGMIGSIRFDEFGDRKDAQLRIEQVGRDAQ